MTSIVTFVARSRASERTREIAKHIAVAAVYFVSARLSLRISLVGHSVTPLWPPTGIAVVALLWFGYRVAPAITVSAFLVNVSIAPHNASSAAVIAAGNTLAPVAAVAVLRWAQFRPSLERVRDAVALVFGAALASMLISASIGTASLIAFQSLRASRFLETWSVWWAGDAMGVLLVAPFLWSLPRIFRPPIRAARVLEAVLLFAALAAVSMYTFRTPRMFAVLPVLGVIAWRFQQRLAAAAGLLASSVAIWAAVANVGPFMGESLLHRMFLLQTFNATVAFTTFFFAAALEDRVRTQAALKATTLALEQAVGRRTEQLRETITQLHEQIGGRGEAERALRESESGFRTLFESAALGMARLSVEGRYTTLNAANVRLLGADEEDLTGASFTDFVHPEDRSRNQDLFGRLVAGQLASFEIEKRLVRKDGSHLWVHNTVSLVRDDAGAPKFVLSIIQDLTERRRSESLQRAEIERARLHEMLARLPALVVVTRGEDHVVEFVNQAFAQALGGRDPSGRPLREVLPEFDEQGQIERMDDVLSTSEPFAVRELPMSFGGAEEGFYNIAYQPMRSRDGRVEGILAHAVDVSEIVRGRQRLAESLAFLDTLLRNAPAGFAVFDSQMRYVRINERLAEMNGIPAEAHIGKTLREILPEWADELEGHLKHVLKTRVPVEDLELSRPTPGETRDWLASYYPVTTPEGTVVGVGSVVVEITDRKRVERLLAGQKEVFERVARGDDLFDVVDALARLTERQSSGNVRAAILLVTDSGRMLQNGAAPGLAPEIVALHGVPISEDGPGFAAAAALGEPSFSNDVLNDRAWSAARDRLVQNGIRAVWSWPIVGGDGSRLGVVVLYCTSSRAPNEQEDELARVVAQTASIAIERERTERDRERLLQREREVQVQLYEREHRVAETLQRSLLPETLPDTSTMQVAVRYIPASADVEVGGDWYDVIPLTDGKLGVVIGDVAGHGIAAAAAMGQLRMALRAYALEDLSPAESLERLNALLLALQPGEMATLLYAQLDPTSGEICFSSAGHLPPIVALGGEATFLEGGLAPPLGVSADVSYQERSTTIDRAGTLLLYTDGLVERRDESIDEGLARLAGVVREAPLEIEPACDYIIGAMLTGQASDDVALVALRAVSFVGRPLHLQRPAVPSVAPDVRRVMSLWLAHNGAGDEESYDILVACSEAFANAVHHAYGLGDGTVEIEAVVEEGDVVLVVRDRGSWRPQGNGSPESGRGLPMMHGLMDSVEIASGTDGTEVRMRRRLGALVHG